MQLEGILNAIDEMQNTYSERKIGRHEVHDNNNCLVLVVSTVEVYDSDFAYETAVSHLEYNQGNWVIVESYHVLTDAACGHDKWVKQMTSAHLPDQLVDVSGAGVAKLADGIKDSQAWRVKPRHAPIEATVKW